jgi:ABC-type multidrug transport system fused ATPase/permease subunit
MEAKSIETKTKKKVGKLLVLMFKWIGRHWPLMIISLILLAIITYLRSIIPLFGQYIIDVILKYSDEGSTLPMFLQELISADTQAKQLLLAAIVLVGVELFRSILIFLRLHFRRRNQPRFASGRSRLIGTVQRPPAR